MVAVQSPRAPLSLIRAHGAVAGIMRVRTSGLGARDFGLEGPIFLANMLRKGLKSDCFQFFRHFPVDSGNKTGTKRQPGPTFSLECSLRIRVACLLAEIFRFQFFVDFFNFLSCHPPQMPERFFLERTRCFDHITRSGRVENPRFAVEIIP